MSKSVS